MLRTLPKASSVRPLAPTASGTIRSTSIISSFSCIAEELIANAIDAHASIIEVYVDLKGYNIKVVDNGVGISREDMETAIGHFGSTSKYADQLSYGCKGEALAAIARLASLEVRSKCSGSHTTTRLVLDKASSITSDYDLSVSSGTTVIATDIFRHLPVRRKALKPHVETNKIREAIKRYSLVHVQIGFSLYDFGKQKLLLGTPSCRSTLDRLAAYHDPRLVQALEPVDVALQDESSYSAEQPIRRVSGWISPPASECCFSTTECQYVFINKRWCRNAEIVSDLINSVFRKFVTADFANFGVKPKHFESSDTERSRLFPGFVLYFEAPHADVDVLVDPDKNTVMYRNSDTFRALVSDALRGLFQKHVPGSLKSLVAYLDCNVPTDGGMVARGKRSREIDISHEAKMSKMSKCTPSVFSPSIQIQSSARAFSADVPEVSFEDAFECHYPGPFASAAENAGDDAMLDEGLHVELVPRSPEFGVLVFREPDPLTERYDKDIILCPFESDDQIVSVIHQTSPPDYLDRSEGFHHDYGPVDVAEVSVPFEGSECDGGTPIPNHPDVFAESEALLDLDQDFRIVVSPQSAGSSFNSLLRKEPSSLYKSADDVALRRRVCFVPEESVVQRSDLLNCTPIGQFDNKVIIVQHEGVLIAIDQHAADERIRLESLSQALNEAIDTFPVESKPGILEEKRLDPPSMFTLQTADVFIMTTFSRLLRKWGFTYKVINERDGDMQFQGRLETSPAVANELLTANDFLEFLVFLRQQESSFMDDDDIESPEENGASFASLGLLARRLRPPAVSRILASKACRGAIMFGDTLSSEEVCGLVNNLAACSLPFQCAHGRPSVYPIADLSQLLASQRRKKYKYGPDGI